MEKFKIGDKVYVIDNSYSFTIGTTTNPYLAGCGNRRILKRKRVTIVSEPYNLMVDPIVIDRLEREMITVSYNRKCHVVINRLTKN